MDFISMRPPHMVGAVVERVAKTTGWLCLKSFPSPYCLHREFNVGPLYSELMAERKTHFETGVFVNDVIAVKSFIRR